MFNMNPQFDWRAFGGQALQDLGYGLSSSPTLGNAFGAATRRSQDMQPYRDQQATLEEERRRDALEKNQTSEWIKANFPQYSNLPPAQAWQAAMGDLAAKRSQVGSGPVDPSDSTGGRAQLAQTWGLTGDEAKQYVLTGKLPGGNDTPRYGNAPIYARNKQGEYIAIQPGSDGSLNNLSSQLPEGFSIDPGALNSDRAAGTAYGTAQGGVQFNLPAAKENVDKEIANIDAILADKTGLSQTFGNAVQVGPIGLPNQWLPTLPNTPKANLQERVKQVVGQNFLQAFASLKGAGAITEVEGSKAQEAMARLGSAQDQQSFETALNDLKKVLVDGYHRMAGQATAGPYQSSGYTPPALGSDPVAAADALLNSGKY